MGNICSDTREKRKYKPHNHKKPEEQEEYEIISYLDKIKEGDIIKQDIPDGKIKPIESEREEKIIKQLKIYICKINECQGHRTGFFCKIPFPDEFNYLPVLITNKNIINKEELLIKKKN